MGKKLALIAGLLLALAVGGWLAYPMNAVAWAAWVQAAGVLAAIWTIGQIALKPVAMYSG